MIRQIVLCGRIVNYDLQSKKVKNINLRIRMDGSIQVSANRKTGIEKIEAFISSKGEWIISALNKIEIKNEENAKREAMSEGHILLWGEKIDFSVVEGKRNSYKYKGNQLEISLKDIYSSTARKAVIVEFYKSECKKAFPILCENAYKKFSAESLPHPKIKYRYMKTRWGSCNVTNSILTFNIILAAMPIECAEYVVFHEFCHFLHANHSDEFYKCLSEYMPDWKRRKLLLKKMEASL